MSATRTKRLKLGWKEVPIAQALANRLNERPKSAEARKIKLLLADLHFLWFNVGNGALEAEWQVRYRATKEKLSKYRLTPDLDEIHYLPMRGKTPKSPFVAWKMRFSLCDQNRSMILGSILRLAESGGLWLIRNCQGCAKWYVARKDWQEFCTKSCRLKSKPWRERRADYMRKFRRGA
jgi:hypothetical protein